MRSSLRRSTLAFVLAVVSTSLRPARADDVPSVVQISSTLTRASDRVGQLSVTAGISNGFHIYAMTQPRPFLATPCSGPFLASTLAWAIVQPAFLTYAVYAVVALRADKTKPAPEVDETLRRLGNKSASIPFYAIFPSKSSNKPILLDGLFTSPIRSCMPFARLDRLARGARFPYVARTIKQTRMCWSGKLGIARSAHERS